MKSIVITGCSTGIGRSAAIELARNFRVFAGVRSAKTGEELKVEAGANLVPIQIDVTDVKSIAAAARVVSEQSPEGVYGLVNNAGIVVAGPIEGIPLDEFRKQFDVNVIGLVAVTQAFLPLVRKARGRVVNVGSIAGRITVPFIGAYSASKFAVEAISDALRRELEPHGVKVSLIEPGSVDTPIWDKSFNKAEDLRSGLAKDMEVLYSERMNHFENMAKKLGRQGISVNHVTKAITHALSSSWPKTRYLVGAEAKVTAFLAKVVPDKAMDIVFDKRI